MRMLVPHQDVGRLLTQLFGIICLSINVRAYSIHVVTVMLICCFGSLNLFSCRYQHQVLFNSHCKFIVMLIVSSLVKPDDYWPKNACLYPCPHAYSQLFNVTCWNVACFSLCKIEKLGMGLGTRPGPCMFEVRWHSDLSRCIIDGARGDMAIKWRLLQFYAFIRYVISSATLSGGAPFVIDRDHLHVPKQGWAVMYIYSVL